MPVPSPPAAAPFQGDEGNQRTEIHFDPSTGLVTLKMQVQDPSGYFIPNIRREDFAVYENGLRQRNVNVNIEHAPVAVGLLFEYGGRSSTLDNALGEEVSLAVQDFLNEVGPKDRVAAWKYGDTLEQISGFSQGSESLVIALASLQTPPFSEQNFYDALIGALRKMQAVHGRKALIVLSSGLDTFSKATRRDALRAVRESGTPVYVVDLGPRSRSASPPSRPKVRTLAWIGRARLPGSGKSRWSPAAVCIHPVLPTICPVFTTT